MKITDQDVIKAGEQDLIDAITGELDWGVLEKIFEQDHQLKIGEDVNYKKGDIVIHDNQVAYQLEFDVNVTLSLLVDRNGSCLSLISSADTDTAADVQEDSAMVELEKQVPDDPVPDDNPLASSGQTDPPVQPEKAAKETKPPKEPEEPEETDVSNPDANGKDISADDGQDQFAATALKATNLIEEINSSTLS